ncbi:MAG: hypothetical protein MAG551_00988 [Candidatus Scalindua arabica]|uniref:Carbamoyltransferase domain-containing protein n=1 Tax=Candidatus Scalindua arabica TaxID=1127984 RepID=A0A941W4P0_9BACT|nr:hypothetical protein [Candidatus Scalindua arabica]
MIILGVTHPVVWNNGACILVDGKLIAMVEEERLNRLKHAVDIPAERAIEFCLNRAGITLDDVDYFAIGWESMKGHKIREQHIWEYC